MNKIVILFLLFTLSISFRVNADSREVIKKSTDILMFAPSVAGLITTVALQDYQGTKQMLFSTATCVAATYLLKYTIKKERPDGSDLHSFPSSHTSIAFQGASFIQRRYGWKVSIPAYVISAYVAWGRVYSKRHDWWDVVGGAAIGVGSSYIFTRPFAKKHNLTIAPVTFGNDSWGIYASITI